jgi:hypothetical protein
MRRLPRTSTKRGGPPSSDACSATAKQVSVRDRSGSRRSSRLSHKAVSEKPRRACGKARQSSHARRPPDERHARDGRDGRFRNPALETGWGSPGVCATASVPSRSRRPSRVRARIHAKRRRAGSAVLRVHGRAAGDVDRRTGDRAGLIPRRRRRPRCRRRRTSPPAPSIVATTIRSMVVSRPSESSGTASSKRRCPGSRRGGRGVRARKPARRGPPLPRRAYPCCQALIKPCGLKTNFFAAPWSKSL